MLPILTPRTHLNVGQITAGAGVDAAEAIDYGVAGRVGHHVEWGRGDQGEGGLILWQADQVQRLMSEMI